MIQVTRTYFGHRELWKFKVALVKMIAWGCTLVMRPGAVGGGVPVSWSCLALPRSCLGGVSRSCLAGVLVMFRWCRGHVLVFGSCFGGDGVKPESHSCCEVLRVGLPK